MPIDIQGYIQESNGLVSFSSNKPEIFKMESSLEHKIRIKNFNIGNSKIDFSSLGNIHYWNEQENLSNNIYLGQPLSSIAIKNNSATLFELGTRQLLIVDDKGKKFEITIEFDSESREIYSLKNVQTEQKLNDRTLFDNISLFSQSQVIDKKVTQAVDVVVDNTFYDVVLIGSEYREPQDYKDKNYQDYIAAPDKQGRHLIYGRSGNDLLIGGQGQEIYYFELGDGKDIIANLPNVVNSRKTYLSDILKFGEGISINNISMVKENNDLLIEIKETQDSVRINSYFSDKGGNSIRLIEFYDGYVMKRDEINKFFIDNNPQPLNAIDDQASLLMNAMSTLTNKSDAHLSIDNQLVGYSQSIIAGGPSIILNNNNS